MLKVHHGTRGPGIASNIPAATRNNSALGCGESISWAHEICWVREPQVPQTDHINPKMKQRSFPPPSFSPAVINHRNNEASACHIQATADASGRDFCDWRSFVPSDLYTLKVYEKHVCQALIVGLASILVEVPGMPTPLTPSLPVCACSTLCFICGYITRTWVWICYILSHAPHPDHHNFIECDLYLELVFLGGN